MVPIVMHPGARENAEFRPYVNIGFRERPAKHPKNVDFIDFQPFKPPDGRYNGPLYPGNYIRI